MYTVKQKGEEMCVAAGQGMCTIQQVEVMYSSRVRECTAAGRGNVQKRGERIYVQEHGEGTYSNRVREYTAAGRGNEQKQK